MSKIGWLVVTVATLLGVGYLTGFIGGDAGVNLTDKGRSAVSTGIDATQGAVDQAQEGLDSLNPTKNTEPTGK